MSSRRRLFTGLAGAALALALAGGGAAAASASTAAPATLTAVHHPIPMPVKHLNGFNVLKLVDGTTTYTYPALFLSHYAGGGVWVISGIIRDNYEPVHVNLQVHGIQFGNDVVLSVSYPTTGPDAGNQGVRTFSGVIGAGEHVTGDYSETGPENIAGTFLLVFPAH